MWLTMWRILAKKIDLRSRKRYVFYKGETLEIEEEGRNWLIISNGTRLVFCRKDDVDVIEEDFETSLDW